MDVPTLMPANDDPQLNTDNYQAELRHFHETIKKVDGIKVSSGFRIDRAGIQRRDLGALVKGLYEGKFTIELASTIGPPLIAGIAGWLTGRAGRKVRVKVGDLEVEAPTIKEVENLLARAREIRASQTKVILEP